MKTLLTVIAFVSCLSCFAQQSFIVGAASTNGVTYKLVGEITMVDSTYTFTVGNKSESRQITSQSPTAVYLTDGGAVDQLLIAEQSGKTKGFLYTHVLTYQQDKRYTGTRIVYFCIKKN